MICPTCQASITDDSHFCSSCGSPTHGAAVALADPPEMRVLAEANLLRMRGQWEDAEGRCIDVMRADPNNVHAHSLLGDIYRDQGLHEEAAQWYRMALDLNPSSEADRTKLEMVERESARRIARSGPAPSSNGSRLAVGTQKLMGMSPVVWVRVLTALTVLFLVMVAAMLMLMQKSRQPAPSVPRTSLPTVVPPPATGAPMSSGYAGAPFAFVPRAPAPANPPSATSAPTASGSVNSVQSQRESALQNAVTRLTGPGTSMTVAGVAVDPRMQQATLTLIHHPDAQELSSGIRRDAVITAAFRAAQAALMADDQLQRVMVSVRLNSGAGRAEPFFEGDLDRNATAFSNPWWAAPPALSSPSDGGSDYGESP
jgi:hypothetical protein